jgi:protein-tyrosine phosphatase
LKDRSNACLALNIPMHGFVLFLTKDCDSSWLVSGVAVTIRDIVFQRFRRRCQGSLMKSTQILFVCMGNICRSPTAEGVMRKHIDGLGLSDRIIVDSAGTHDYHVGEAPDPRAQAAARRRGYDLSGLRARQVNISDFERFDLVLAMDFNNLASLQGYCPPSREGKMGLLMPYARTRRSTIVHDPYYRSARDFDLVLDCIEDACKGLLDVLSSGSVDLSWAGRSSHSKLNSHSNAWAFPPRASNSRM